MPVGKRLITISDFQEGRLPLQGSVAYVPFRTSVTLKELATTIWVRSISGLWLAVCRLAQEVSFLHVGKGWCSFMCSVCNLFSLAAL